MTYLWREQTARGQENQPTNTAEQNQLKGINKMNTKFQASSPNPLGKVVDCFSFQQTSIFFIPPCHIYSKTVCVYIYIHIYIFFVPTCSCVFWGQFRGQFAAVDSVVNLQKIVFTPDPQKARDFSRDLSVDGFLTLRIHKFP